MNDLTAVLSALGASTHGFVATLDGLSTEHWGYRTAPERWSISDTAEHTAVVLRGVERLCATKILAMPLAADDPSRRVRDGDATRQMADRGRPLPAPELVKPKGRWPTREEFIADFVGYSDGLIGWARSCPVNLRSIGAPHPLFGPLDALQWLEFLAAHANRHAEQVQEIRRAGGV